MDDIKRRAVSGLRFSMGTINCSHYISLALVVLLCANKVLTAPQSDVPDWFQKARDAADSSSTAMMGFMATGGMVAAPCVYKGAAFLHDTYKTFLCGGTLIDELHVLTAFHCTLGRAVGDLQVHFGNWNIYNYDDGEQIRLVSSVTSHPIYDVAIIELARNVTFNDCVEPTRLYKDRPIVSRPLIVVGWGLTEVNSWHTAEDLQAVMVPVVDSDICIADIQLYDSSETVTDYEFCAGSSTGAYRNICAGDSGGAIYDHLDGYGWVAVGFAVRGMGAAVPGCPEDGHYAIFRGLSDIAHWIEANSETEVYSRPTPPPPPPQPSGGGGGGGGFGCFPGVSTVELKSGERRLMSDLVPGDEVLAMDNNGQVTYSAVITILRAERLSSMKYCSLKTTSGKELRASEYHLVYTGDCSSTSVSYNDFIYAKDLQVGDCLRVRVDSDGNNQLSSEMQEISEISMHKLDGAYAPLTTLGTIVVDDVAASCYAVIRYHGLGQLAFAPVQYLYPWLPDVFLARQNVSENAMFQWYPKLIMDGVLPVIKTLSIY